tara:strand:- start:712 stop:2949 length:2238 start_codon:yes stop_codon:yes gene_type:complete
MFNIIFQILLFSLFIVFSAFSKNYEKIIINGNERISDETILVYSNLSEKNELDEDSINNILKNIYDTGFFKDVAIEIKNKILLINVTENPIIQSVFIEGIKSSKILDEITDNLSLKDRSSFNVTNAKNDEILILNLLKDRGYYFSTLITTVEELGDNKINLIHNVTLGKRAKISKISFIGEKIFKDRQLRNIIISEEYKIWKIVSGKKFLNEEMVNFDKKLLNIFYKNNGYFNVVIESSFANYLGEDQFELLYNIFPGQKYFFNDLSLELPADFDKANFDDLNKIFKKLKGKKYSLNAINSILDEIDKIVLNEEFEFLKSNVYEKINDNLINLTFNIEESEKFYVEKINIFGNNVTRENVIRNNLIVDEGDAFNEILHKKSINNIKSLNIFSLVNSEILKNPNNNQKIINITVNEKPTGEISAGAGVGTNGASVNFGVRENNFLGRGIELSTNLSISEKSIRGITSLNNPNYKGTNKSLKLSAESSVTDNLKNFGYKSNKTGLSIGTGFEYYKDLFLNVGISSYAETLKTDASASTNIQKQKGSYFDTFLNYSFSFDKRNQRFKPSKGFKATFIQNVPLISEALTLNNTFDYKIYNEWLDKNIATIGFYASSTTSLASKSVKLSERLHVPGSKLRGFQVGKIGPKDSLDYIGGNYLAVFNASTTLPQILPNLQNTDFSIFFDAANIWGTDYDSSIAQDNRVRSSIGLAVDIFTPIGPLNFTFTEVISKDSKDVTESFRFNLGTTF